MDGTDHLGSDFCTWLACHYLMFDSRRTSDDRDIRTVLLHFKSRWPKSKPIYNIWYLYNIWLLTSKYFNRLVSTIMFFNLLNASSCFSFQTNSLLSLVISLSGSAWDDRLGKYVSKLRLTQNYPNSPYLVTVVLTISDWRCNSCFVLNITRVLQHGYVNDFWGREF